MLLRHNRAMQKAQFFFNKKYGLISTLLLGIKESPKNIFLALNMHAIIIHQNFDMIYVQCQKKYLLKKYPLLFCKKVSTFHYGKYAIQIRTWINIQVLEKKGFNVFISLIFQNADTYSIVFSC